MFFKGVILARSRNIKPSIMDNEKLAECAPLTRLLFVYLWMLADREGRLEDRPKRIAAQALAYDRVADVGIMLDDLQAAGFITRYTTDSTACIQIINFTKHQSPHVREVASVLPCMVQSTTKVMPSTNLGTTKASTSTSLDRLNPDSLLLNPDTRILNPDSLNPDILNPEPKGFGGSATHTAPDKAKRVKVEKIPVPTKQAWEAYSTAYETKYQTEPVRNAMVNGQLAQLVARLGAADAPLVAGWYLGHRNQFYVSCGHSVAMLLRDCEKLRSEWVTGRQGTHAQAVMGDKTQANYNAFAPLIAEAKAREALERKTA